MSSFIQGIKQFFIKLKNGIQSITRKLFGKKKSGSRKKRVAPAPPPAPASAPAPAPAPPAPPAPTQGPAAPQTAGRKMRAKNLRRMKFYKPSRRVMKKGRTVSRRNKYV